MALESVTHISDLDAANPAFGDPISQGDNHLRNIKTALKTDLPNITGPVTATQAELNVLAGIASNGVVVRTGAGTGTTRTITAGTGISVSNGDGVSGNPTIAVTPGVGLGDVIGPAGATSGALAIYDGTTGKLLKAGGSASHAGSLDFSGSGLRLTGDFSNATDANRLLFENSVTNSVTAVGAKPSGTGAFGALYSVYSTTDTANSVVGQFHAVASGTELRLNSNRTGSASFAPMTFYTGGSERLRIDTGGNVGVGGAPAAGQKLHVFGGANRIQSDVCSLAFASSGAVNNWYIGANVSDGVNAGFHIGQGLGITGGTPALVVDVNRNILSVGSGGLGYGVGSGGTVAQATSKSTAVTLNKPCGQITMNAAALGAGARVTFVLNNSLVTANDVVVVSIDNSSVGFAGFNYQVTANASGGAAVVHLVNVSGGSLSEAVALNFAVVKGATS